MTLLDDPAAGAALDITPIVGLPVHLKRTRDKPCARCRSMTVVIDDGKAMHTAAMMCHGCGRHRGWLPAQAVAFWLDTVRIFGALDHVVLQDTTLENDGAAMGEAVAVSSTTQQGAKVMGRLGFTYGGSENILPYVKYDARSGRFFRNDRVENKNTGKFENNAVEITFKAVMDLENIEVGFINYVDGKAPEYLLVPAGAAWPIKPTAAGWKQGVRGMLKLDKDCGGDVREITSNAQAFLKGFEDLMDQYEVEKHKHSGKLPVVTVNKTLPLSTGAGGKKSTNYQPEFKITGWVDRPDDLVFVPKQAGDEDAPY